MVASCPQERRRLFDRYVYVKFFIVIFCFRHAVHFKNNILMKMTGYNKIINLHYLYSMTVLCVVI